MAEAAQNLDQLEDDVLSAFKPYEHFCRSMLDAYVVVDCDGKVVKSNQLFSQLVGKTSKQILRTDSFDELLKLYIEKTKVTIKDILNHNTPTRIDEVRGENFQHSDLNLIIGIYPFISEATGKTFGAYVMIRDVTAETNLQGKYKEKAIKSITDPLTGLFTRNYFEEYLNTQVEASRKLPKDAPMQNITLALIDIDFFKKVNDLHGHQAGDQVLQVIANIMKKTFRKYDIVCRYGGEEFLVILPEKIHDALTALEKLRNAVENEKIIFDDQQIQVTISAGIAQINFDKENYHETIARADTALYAAKENGRNLVSLHDGRKIQSIRFSK